MDNRATLAPILETLEMLDLAGQLETLELEAVATGGLFHAPESKNTWDSQRYTIQVHGVFVDDAEPAAAIRFWCQIARRRLQEYEAVMAAYDIICREGPVDTAEARAACHIILEDGREHQAVFAANEILTLLNKVAA